MRKDGTLSKPERTNRRASFVTWRSAAACLALLLCVACGYASPPPWEAVLAPQPTPTPPTAPPTANTVVVYLDTSVSMAGYVTADRQGQTIYGRALQELRNLVSVATPALEVTVRRVDAAVGAPNPDSFLTQASFDKGVYTGRETNIAGAIGMFNHAEAAHAGAQLQKASAVEPQPEAPQPGPRFHVLVTDGVQSQRQGGGDCTGGSDQVCVRKRILSLLGAGWGGYVIGMRSEFQGKVFSETGGRPVDFTSNKRDPQTFRPFYIYLFSPDRAALDGLATTLVKQLRPLVPDEGCIRTLALTSTYAAGDTPAELTIEDKAAADDNPARLLELETQARESPRGFVLHVSPDTERLTQPVPFAVETSIPWSANVSQGGSPRELAELIDWRLTPDGGLEEKLKAEEGGALRFPELKLAGQKVGPDGKVSLTINAKFPLGAAPPQWRVYRLEGRLNLQQQTPQWINEWSTDLDTTASAASKTLYLKSALLGLWRNPELEQQTVALVYIMAGP